MTTTGRQIVNDGISMAAITQSKPDAADKPAPATAIIRLDDCKTLRNASTLLEGGIVTVLDFLFLARCITC